MLQTALVVFDLAFSNTLEIEVHASKLTIHLEQLLTVPAMQSICLLIFVTIIFFTAKGKFVKMFGNYPIGIALDPNSKHACISELRVVAISVFSTL